MVHISKTPFRSVETRDSLNAGAVENWAGTTQKYQYDSQLKYTS